MFGLVEPPFEGVVAGHIFAMFINPDSEVQLHTGASIVVDKTVFGISAFAAAVTERSLNRRHHSEPAVKIFPI